MFIPLLCILLCLPVPALDTNGEESSGVGEPSFRGTKLKCTNPPGRIGKSFTRGCLKKTCTHRGKIAFWKKAYTRKKCCNYDQKWLKIRENITLLAPDNCTIVHVHCVKNKKAAPKIRMDTTHTCVYDEKEEATLEPHCCPQVIVDGVPYQLNKSTENTICPSSCVYGSDNSSQLFCLDSTANKSLCMASKHPKGNRGQSGCAEVYWDSHFYGLHITIPESSFYNLDNANGIGPWNDEISSWKVSSGCSLTVYEAHSYHYHNGNYGGQQWAGNTGDNPWIGSSWNDRISSLSCTCPVPGFSVKDGIISSANFPSNYENNIEDTHEITVPTGHLLFIRFVEFDLEYQRKCGYDFLKIEDTYGNKLFFGCGSMHGSSVPENFPTLIKTTLGVTITFKTDSSVTKKGFQLKVHKSVPGFSVKDGIISSANFPSNYENTIEDTHQITVPTGHLLFIRFVEFDLEYQGKCGYDSLKIVDIYGNKLFFGCGSMHGSSVPDNFPASIETTVGVTITFKTDSSVTRKGFQLQAIIKGEELDIFNELLSKHTWMNSSNEEERQKRFLLWKTRKDKIDEHNKLHAENKTTYRKAVNKFTIMFDSEFEASYKGLSMPKRFYNKKASRQTRKNSKTGGKKTDWRDPPSLSRVSNVQDQNPNNLHPGCGSCWAFSATGAIEAAYMRSKPKGQLVDLSESNLINCMEDDTCLHGSNPLEAFYYVSKNGIATAKCIHYIPKKSKCQTGKTCQQNLPTKIQSWVIVDEGELNLQVHMDKVGPVSVLICAHTDKFREYKDGIFDEADCSSHCDNIDHVDHAVLVVGYGEETVVTTNDSGDETTEKNKPYWLVKNSWGTDWGENGYIKMARNKNNQCEISSFVSYPVLEGEEVEDVICNATQKEITEMFGKEEHTVYCCDSGLHKTCKGADCATVCTTTTEVRCLIILKDEKVKHQPHCNGKPKGTVAVSIARALCRMAVRCPVAGSQRGCSCCTKPDFKTKCQKKECSNCPRGEATYGPLTEGILIAGGFGGDDARYTTEIFLPGSGKSCAMHDLPAQTFYHTLDTVDGVGILCGGGYGNGRKSCLQFNQTTEAWSSYATTEWLRWGHSSWVSAAGLIIMGGYYSLTTTEIVNGGMNFTLVQDTQYACSIQLGDYTIITGGRDTPTDVSKYNLQGHVEGNLPSLLEGRMLHACGSLRDGHDKQNLVVAGGWSGSAPISTSEKYILGSLGTKWTVTVGKALPRAMYGMASVSLDKEVIILGGQNGLYGNSSKYRSEILSYKAGSWTKIGQLRKTRSFAAATTILVDPTICG